MRQFFESETAIGLFLDRLHSQACPFCGANGTLVRHGYIRGAVSETEYGIRAWRIFCDPDSPNGRGCGRAPSVRTSVSLLRRCFVAGQLWLFILALLSHHSVRSSWKQSSIRLSLRAGYRLFHRLTACQSVFRTSLCARAPPPREGNAGSPLLQALTHLKKAFCATCAVSAYQENTQKDFLALA